MLRRTTILGVALAVVALPTPANAAPTYLVCEFKDGRDEPFAVNVTVDEANAAVTVHMPRTGFSRRYQAVFSPDEVLFADRDLSYRLSRVDLTMVRTVKILRSDESTVCQLIAPPTRAF